MSIRRQRINEEIKKGISDIIREMKDPRVATLTSVLFVEVTSDLKWATVRVSVYDPDEKKRAGTVDALNGAGGFIARELGRRVDLRRMPQLKFVQDTSIEYSVHISDVIRRIGAEGTGNESEDR